MKMMMVVGSSYMKKNMMTMMKVGSSSSSSSSSKLISCKSSNNIDYATYLLDDIWFEIFLLLPLKSIFKYRCVSKLWLSLLSNPTFITKWIRFNNLSTSWTLVFRIGSPEDHHLDIQTYSTASLDLYSKFISNHDGFSFKFLQDKKFLLASSNGLVLCSTSLNKHKRYYVCNPLTKEWVSLPPSSQQYSDKWVINGFICESSSSFSSTSTCYKVVRIPRFKKRTTKFHVEIFSSDTGEWNIYEVCCPGRVSWQCPLFSNVVTHNGVMYWIGGRNKIIVYDLNNNNNKSAGHQCSFIDLPKGRGRYDTFQNRCLGVSKGSICYGVLKISQKTLSVWVLQEDYINGGWVWDLVHKDIDLKDMLAEINCCLLINGQLNAAELIRPLAFNPFDRNVVIFHCYMFILAFNIQTRRYEVLHSPHLIPNRRSFRTRHEDLPFVLTPSPTIRPPPSWSDTSVTLTKQCSSFLR
ncbi:F-box domain [Macleaya cordata]|uniref:F-box domain n=1 Tax=Macleaya cordata TaxID=56857 RepID=A0A200QMW7_MACCD|nr:F-box domain [Macleaya cordata]